MHFIGRGRHLPWPLFSYRDIYIKMLTMANEVKKYRIWIRRDDTHQRITDENIWVGNIHIPSCAPYCKHSSGLTMGAEYAYVEFATWDDLLKAIGDNPEPVNLTLDGELVQEGGGSVDLTLDGTLVQEDAPEPTPVGISLAGELTQE